MNKEGNLNAKRQEWLDQVNQSAENSEEREDALAHLVCSYRGLICYIVGTHKPFPHIDADDFLQEMYLQISKHCASRHESIYPDVQFFKHFLCRMLRHKIIDALRYTTAQKRAIPGEKVPLEEITCDDVSILSDCDVDARQQLLGMLPHLSDQDREIVLMKMEGETWKRIAEKYGQSLQTVQRRVMRHLRNAADKN